MRIRHSHELDTETISALSERKSGKSLRALAAELGLDKGAIATLSAVLRGRSGTLTLASENVLRMHLGLTLLPEPRLLAPCPTCLGDHGMKEIPDCHGAPIAAIVVLAPGEQVTRKGKARTRKHYRRPCLSDDPGLRLDQLWILVSEAEAELITQRKETL
jgi:hypothetical protein